MKQISDLSCTKGPQDQYRKNTTSSECFCAGFSCLLMEGLSGLCFLGMKEQ